MKDYLLNSLKTGNYFSREVFLDENYIILSQETPFDEQLKNRLLRWDYAQIHSEGTPVEGPSVKIDDPVPETINLNSQLKEQEHLKNASLRFNEMLQFTDNLFNTFSKDGKIPLKDLTEKIKTFADSIRNLRQFILRYDEFEASSNMTAVQSVKTSIVSIILGQELHFPPHRLIELGISSLLHNIGMLKLPSELYMSDKILSEQERKVISTHPILAFKTLKAQQYPMNVCLAVLESHENMDGSGYPQHINGAHINQYSKIIAICSSYAAMTSKRPFRISMNAYQAMLELLKMRDIRYDSHMLNVLVKSLSLYPIGTFVQIKNGAQGMVVNTQADKPRAPIIRLLRESTGEIYRKSSTVSTDKPEYQITSVLPPDKTTALKAALKH